MYITAQFGKTKMYVLFFIQIRKRHSRKLLNGILFYSAPSLEQWHSIATYVVLRPKATCVNVCCKQMQCKINNTDMFKKWNWFFIHPSEIRIIGWRDKRWWPILVLGLRYVILSLALRIGAATLTFILSTLILIWCPSKEHHMI